MRTASCSEVLTAGGDKATIGFFVENVISLLSAGEACSLEALALAPGAVNGVADRSILHSDFGVGRFGGASSKKQEQKKPHESSKSKRATGPRTTVLKHRPAPLHVTPCQDEALPSLGTASLVPPWHGSQVLFHGADHEDHPLGLH